MSNELKQPEPRWDIAFVGDEGDPDRVRIFAVGLPGQKWGAIGMECRGEVCVRTGKAWIELARENRALRNLADNLQPGPISQAMQGTRDETVARLHKGLKDLIHAYVRLLESGRDRIASLGADCDSVEIMERGDPCLRQAREALTGFHAEIGPN